MTEQKELAIVGQETVVAAPRMERPEHPLADLRHAAMSVPLDQIRDLLTDYARRRAEFRSWLMTQLEQAVHFGVPPGCEPRPVNPLQWKNRPSLYKAGAEFICDLMNVRAKYTADMDAAAQLGESKDAKYFVYKCELISRQTGEVLGEGTGARQLGAKKGDVNNSVKMAQKNALVAAVLNVYGLSDLFTQDLGERQEFDNPDQTPNAPKVAPRGDRFSRETINGFFKRWREYLNPKGQPCDFTIWLQETTARRGIDFTKPPNWTPEMRKAVEEALAKVEPPHEG